MSNDVAALKDGGLPAKVSSKFEGMENNEDLESIIGGFAIVSIRGSKFRVKHGGTEELITNDEGDPRGKIEVVLLKAQNSKAYYSKQYAEGDVEEPDCFSMDGVKPDPSASVPQCKTCAACPHNVWGSRLTDEGKKSRACPDAKRIALVPAEDLENEALDGPMMLRVPAASLKDLTMYSKGLTRKGYPYQSVVTRLGFDTDVSYPKLTFKAVRPLNDDEAETVLAHIHGDQVANIMNTLPETAEAQAKPKKTATVDTDFEEEEPEPTPKKPAKKKATKKKAVKKAEPEPEPEPEEPEEEDDAGGTTLDDELDDILSELDDLDV